MLGVLSVGLLPHLRNDQVRPPHQRAVNSDA
jgi:hypothetical protein